MLQVIIIITIKKSVNWSGQIGPSNLRWWDEVRLSNEGVFVICYPRVAATHKMAREQTLGRFAHERAWVTLSRMVGLVSGVRTF